MDKHLSLKNKTHPFTQIPNSLINDKRLTLKSKSILIFLLSKRKTWCFNFYEILINNKIGITSLRSSIKELISFGYLFTLQSRNPDGTFTYSDYKIFETPLKLTPTKTTTQPCDAFPHADGPHADEPHTDNVNTANLNLKKHEHKITTTTSTNVDNTTAAVDEFKLKNQKTEAIQLLNQLNILNSKNIFAKFKLSDILTCARFLTERRYNMRNPTGYFLDTIKEQWWIDDKTKIGDTFDELFQYRCKKCHIIFKYPEKQKNYDFCNKCGGFYK